MNYVIYQGATKHCSPVPGPACRQTNGVAYLITVTLINLYRRCILSYIRMCTLTTGTVAQYTKTFDRENIERRTGQELINRVEEIRIQK